MFNQNSDVVLVLGSGKTFYGTQLGKPGVCYGEVVFNTAMCGYQEILTDPSYAKQIILFTCPHVGNTGINEEDNESAKIWASGLITRNYPAEYSSWRATTSLPNFLSKNDTIGITGIDTRHLTSIIREQGSQYCCIAPAEFVEKNKDLILQNINNYNEENLVNLVTSNKYYQINSGAKRSYHVVIYDFGMKQNIADNLSSLGCDLTIVPAHTNYQKILNLNPDGILLSNGPGDPEKLTDIIVNIKNLIKSNIPMFGICLGYQLLALALGAKTYKMDYGHHGANHPVQDLATHQVIITSQNHGFAVAEENLPDTIKITHRSLFDNSLQGLHYKHKPIFGFQGHPEAGPGPQEGKYIFKQFINLMHQEKICPKEKIYI